MNRICIFSMLLSSIAYGTVQNKDSTVPTQSDPSWRCCSEVSFIYWYAKEDGLQVAENSILGEAGQSILSPNGQVFKQSFSYNPGFKVGIGIQGDEWGLLTRYTWLKARNSTSKSAPDNTSSVSGEGVWNVDDWFLQTTSFGQSPTATSISPSWHLDLDMINLLASNLLYFKKNVKVGCSIGLMTAWIWQKMNISIIQATNSVGADLLPDQPLHSLNRSHSWGIGPKLGLDMQYLLPKGFRFKGAAATSLLYTEFTSVKHKEDAIYSSSPDIQVKSGNYSSVRPILELDCGLGWSIDVFQDKYSFDFLVSYELAFFWGQNVMRQMLDEFFVGTSASPGDLYLHGLTLEAGFKF
jgi:hypothetical protein